MSISIADISLANDLVFGEIMRKPENVKPFLEAVLEKQIAGITHIEKQQDIKDGINLHGVRLDVVLADTKGTQYDIEMQLGRPHDLERRIRYYQSSIDRRTLEPAESYRKLRESYVIFVCTDDYYRKGLALYKRKSIIEGAEELAYEDGSHAYILNAEFSTPNMSKPALDFLRYINARYRKLPIDISRSDYLTQIDRAVEDIKSDKGKVERLMTLATKLEDVRFYAHEEGVRDNQIATVKRMLARNLPLEEIADICGLDLAEVKKIAKDV